MKSGKRGDIDSLEPKNSYSLRKQIFMIKKKIKLVKKPRFQLVVVNSKKNYPNQRVRLIHTNKSRKKLS